MLRITVELLPHGRGPRRTLGVMDISNVGGTMEIGDYSVEIRRGMDIDRVRRSTVRGFPRLSPNFCAWDLVRSALDNALRGRPTWPPEEDE